MRLIPILMTGLAVALAMGCGGSETGTSGDVGGPEVPPADEGTEIRVAEPILLDGGGGTITGMAPLDGAVWVGGADSNGAGTIWHVSRSGDVGTIRLPDVQDIAAASGTVWTVGSGMRDAHGSPTLVRVNAETEEIVERIPLGRDGRSRASAQRVAVGDDGDVWVSLSNSDGTGEILRVDPATNDITARIGVRGAPGDVVPGDGAIWVLSDPRPGTGGVSLHRIDPAVDEIVATPVRGSLHSAGGSEILPSVAAGGGAVWVSSVGADHQKVVRVDAETNVPVTEPTTVRHFSPVAVLGKGVWFVGRGGLSRLDASTGDITGPFDLTIPPVDARLDRANKTLWVADAQGSRIVSVDLP